MYQNMLEMNWMPVPIMFLIFSVIVVSTTFLIFNDKIIVTFYFIVFRCSLSMYREEKREETYGLIREK